MGVLVGLIGVILGVLVGFNGAFLLVAETSDGNSLGDGFALMGYVPFGVIAGAFSGWAASLYLLQYLRREDLGTLTRRKKTWAVVACAASPLALVMGMVWLQHICHRPPFDQKLIANFQRHQADFSRLIHMSQADRNLTCVDGDCTRLDKEQTAGGSAGKAADYQRLLDRVQIGAGFQYSSTPGNTEFLYWGRGSAVSSDTEKGYAYLVTPPVQVRSTLDGCEPDVKNGSHYYRHIQGHWYLYYDYLPG